MINAAVRLRRAIFANDLVLARRIIKNNPQCLRSPDSSDNGNTPLHLAAALGLIDIAMYLIEAGHEDEGISRNFDRETPLMSAVGSINLSSTASSSTITSSGNAALVAASNSIAPSAVEDMVRLLAARFPRCIPWTNRSGLDAFQLAAKFGSDRILTLLLSSAPNRTELLTHTADDGNTALHLASAWGNKKCITLLVSAGADALRTNDDGYNAIDYGSTVAIQVFFRQMIMDLEKRRHDAAAQAVLDNEIKTRRRGGSKADNILAGGPALVASPISGPSMGIPGMPGGVRLVDDREHAINRARSPSLKGMGGAAVATPREPASGRATPSGRRDNWAMGLRGRAGSSD